MLLGACSGPLRGQLHRQALEACSPEPLLQLEWVRWKVQKQGLLVYSVARPSG